MVMMLFLFQELLGGKLGLVEPSGLNPNLGLGFFWIRVWFGLGHQSPNRVWVMAYCGARKYSFGKEGNLQKL